MNIMVECERCKKKFAVGTEVDTSPITKEYDYEGRSLLLTYYDCKHCGYRHFVQIDTIETRRELERVTIMFRDVMAKRAKGKRYKKQSDRLGEARQHLAESRNKLMKEFTGKTVIEQETGHAFVLRFSV